MRRSLLLSALGLGLIAGCKPTDPNAGVDAGAPAPSASAAVLPDLAPLAVTVEELPPNPDGRVGAAGLIAGGTLYLWGGVPDTKAASPGRQVQLVEEVADAAPGEIEDPLGTTLVAFDPKTGVTTNITMAGVKPRTVRFPVMAHDASRQRLHVFSGWPIGSPKPIPALFYVDLAKSPPEAVRQNPRLDGPIGRTASAAATDNRGGAFFIVGGDAGPGPAGPAALGDVWRYDFAGPGFERVGAAGPQPLPRWNASIAMDEENRQLYVYGGTGESVITGDTQLYALSLDELQWRVVEGTGSPPPALQGASMTYDTEHQALVIAGGLRGVPPGDATISEVFVFDVRMQRWTSLDGGTALRRRDHVGAYDPGTRSHVLLGGRVSSLVGDFFDAGTLVSHPVRIRLSRPAAP